MFDRHAASVGSRSPMATTIPLMVALLGAPASMPDSFTVGAVEVGNSDDAVQVLAYDLNGDIAAEIVVWGDGHGRVRVDAGFADGMYLALTADGDDVTVEGDDTAEVRARLVAISDSVTQAAPQASWGKCAAHAVVMAASCASGHVIICAGEAYLVACECYPLIIDDLKGKECK